jgi:hypothetical protein
VSFSSAAILFAWAAILILGMAVAGLLRQVRLLAATGRLGPRVQVGPIVGVPAPPLSNDEDLHGPALILFAARNCRGCAEVVPAFADGGKRDVERLVIYAEEQPGYLPVRTLGNQQRTFDRWNVSVTPFLAAIDSDLRVVAASPVGSPEVLERVMQSFETRRDNASVR